MVVVELQEMSATPGGGGKFFFAVSKPGPDFVEPQFPAHPSSASIPRPRILSRDLLGGGECQFCASI